MSAVPSLPSASPKVRRGRLTVTVSSWGAGTMVERFVYGLSYSYHMSGENLVKFLVGTLDRVRERALGLLGS